METLSPGAPVMHQGELQTPPQGDVLDPAARSAYLLEQVTGPINTALNQRIGYEIQADEARRLEGPLMETQNLAVLADEVRLYQAGEITELSDAAKEAIERGETPVSLLDAATSAYDEYQLAKQEQEAQLGFDEALDTARTAYVELLAKRPLLRGRKEHREKLALAEQAYNEALVAKISKILELDPHHEKAPYAVSTGSEFQKQDPSIEDLSNNQLHLLVDQLSREQVIKAQEIEASSNKGAKRVLNALRSNRGLRVAIGGAIWAGTVIASHNGLLPESLQGIGEVADTVLPLVAGYFTGREVVNGIDEGIESFKRNRQMKRDIDGLTSTTFITEQALRSIYSGVEYWHGRIPARRPGDTQEESKQAFNNIDTEFSKLQREGYRGGKPYGAEVVVPYVADLYLRRRDQIDEILASGNPNEAFLGLCKEVIAADSHQLTERIQANRVKRMVYRGLALAGSIVAGQWIDQLDSMQEMPIKPIKMATVEAV